VHGRRFAVVAAEVRSLAQHASSAAKEIGELVDAAISLMDSITQHNAALVEEASAAAQALDQQSRELDRQVAIFRIV
jgi:methyl-accepting chemotaxis protein-1 (serine sensor receptor)